MDLDGEMNVSNLQPDQFARGDGYAPDPKTSVAGSTRFECQSCGSRYVAPVKLAPEIRKLSSCRNGGCPGPVVRT